MATLNLKGQSALAASMHGRFEQLKQAMNQRREVWNKLSPVQQKAWLDSGKDPLMNAAYLLYKFLAEFFSKVGEL